MPSNSDRQILLVSPPSLNFISIYKSSHPLFLDTKTPPNDNSTIINTTEHKAPDNDPRQSRRLCLLHLSKSLLERLERTVDVVPIWVRDRDTHVSKADIPGSDLLVQSTGEDDATLHKLGQDLWWSQALGQPDGGHAVGLVLGAHWQDRETHVADGLLDFLRGGTVRFKARG